MNEELSRLLDGDLPEAEALRLREQIAADPALAARWAAMQRLVTDLEALPAEMTPPRVAERSAPAPARRAWLLPAALLAAGLLLGVMAPRPAPTLVLTDGTEVVTGEVQVLAGDVSIAVDGKVMITVEPPGGLVREMRAEVPTMDKKALVAALAGSLVTIAVIEGSALVEPANAEPVTLTAGEQRSIGAPDAGSKRRVVTHAPGEEAPPDVASLQKELATLKLEHAITTGQLRALGGTPQEWPAGLPAAFKPEGFEQFVRERVAAIPEASLVAMDCDEYPCIAIVRSAAKTEDWQDKLMPIHDGLENTAIGDDVHVMGFGHHREDGEHDLRLYAFSIMPGEAGPDPEVRTRLDVRVRGDLEGVSSELMDGE